MSSMENYLNISQNVSFICEPNYLQETLCVVAQFQLIFLFCFFSLIWAFFSAGRIEMIKIGLTFRTHSYEFWPPLHLKVLLFVFVCFVFLIKSHHELWKFTVHLQWWITEVKLSTGKVGCNFSLAWL